MPTATTEPCQQASAAADLKATSSLPCLDIAKEADVVRLELGVVDPASMGKAEDCVVEVGDVDTGKVEEAFGPSAAFDDPACVPPAPAEGVPLEGPVPTPLALGLQVYRKIPELNLLYWIMKITATTLGETFADMIAQTMHVGYWQTTLILLSFFVATLILQLCVNRYWPVLYWAVILSTSTAGTTISDWMDRTLHLGYLVGSAILLGILVGVFVVWFLTRLPFSVTGTMSRPAECFYWTAILVSNTLGTALGDCVSDDADFGFAYSALLFGGLIVVVAGVAFLWRRLRVPGFWAAFVLTRPFGAAFGDFLDKSPDDGALGLGTYVASAILGGLLLALLAAAIYVEHFHTRLPKVPGPGWRPWVRNHFLELWGL
eukprot:EG_transcript_14723